MLPIRSSLPLALAASLALVAGCQPPRVAAPELVPPAVTVATGTVSVPLAVLSKRALLGAGFGEAALISQVSLTAEGPGMTPVSTTVPWTPGAAGAPPTVTMAVPAGLDRVFTLRGLDAAGHVLAVMRTLGNVAVGTSQTLRIDANHDAAARVLWHLLNPSPGDPADQSGITGGLASNDLTSSLLTFVTRATGYQEATNSYTSINPRVFRAHLLASKLRASGQALLGAAPTADLQAAGGGSWTVTVTDGGLPVTGQNVQVKLFDPFSSPGATDATGKAAFASVPPGTWAVEAIQGTRTAWGQLTTLDQEPGALTLELSTQASPSPAASAAASPSPAASAAASPTASPSTPAGVASGIGGTVSTLKSVDAGYMDGPSGTARLRYPTAVAIGGGKAYVADFDWVRVVDLATGAISTLQANGQPFNFARAAGVVLDHAGANLYVTSLYGNAIYQVALASGTITKLVDGNAVSLTNICGVVISPQDDYLVVSCPYAQKLRKVGLVGTNRGIVTDLAGTGSFGSTDGAAGTATFANPAAMAIDPAGTSIYVVDSTQKIRKVTLADGSVTTVTGGTGYYAEGAPGTATFEWGDSTGRLSLDLFTATGIAISADGSTLYVSDTRNNRIRKVDVATGVTGLLAGSGTAALQDGTGAGVTMAWPAGFAWNGAGGLVFADYGNRRLRALDPTTGTVTTLAGSGPAVFATGVGATAIWGQACAMALDASHQVLYLKDRITNRVLSDDLVTGALASVAGSGTAGYADGPAASAKFDFIDYAGMQFDAARNCLYVIDNNHLRKIDLATGTVSTVLSGVELERLALDAATGLLYASARDASIKKIDPVAGAVTATITTGSFYTYGLLVDGTNLDFGTLFGYDGTSGLWKIDLASGTQARLTQATRPGGLDGANAVAQVRGVTALGIDPAHQYMYMGDFSGLDPALRRYKFADGSIESVVRNGAGEADGPASSARTNGALDLVVDGAGNVYWIDATTTNLRKLTF